MSDAGKVKAKVIQILKALIRKRSQVIGYMLLLNTNGKMGMRLGVYGQSNFTISMVRMDLSHIEGSSSSSLTFQTLITQNGSYRTRAPFGPANTENVV